MRQTYGVTYCGDANRNNRFVGMRTFGLPIDSWQTKQIHKNKHKHTTKIGTGVCVWAWACVLVTAYMEWHTIKISGMNASSHLAIG